MTVTVKSYAAPPVDENAILRYAGVREADEKTKKLLASCLCEALDALTYKACSIELPLDIKDSVCDFGLFSVHSEKLSKNLSTSRGAVVFTATVGTALDRLIAKYTKLSPARAVMLHAIGAERVEALCNVFCDELRCRYGKVAPRFSPGYGDLPFDVQKDIFRILDCPKNIAVCLTDSLLMSPSKSVTAFVGVSD